MNLTSGFKRKSIRFFFIRHTLATYVNDSEHLKSSNPCADLCIEQQKPDVALEPKGVDLANQQAHTLLRILDPAYDTLCVVSSDQIRAIETANIYIQAAKQYKFHLVNHGKHTGTKLADKVGNGSIRTLDTLSLGKGGAIEYSVFNTHGSVEINWEGVTDPDLYKQWNKARSIVLENDQGTWGGNYYCNSEKVREILPEISTPEDLYYSKYKALLKLVMFSRRKFTDGAIVVLAFGHSNYMYKALEKDTGDHKIRNCEAVELSEQNSLVRIRP